MLIVLFVFLARPHKSEDFLRRIFFLHESAFRPHKTRKSAHLNRIFLKPLFRLKLFFFYPTDLRSREDDWKQILSSLRFTEAAFDP